MKEKNTSRVIIIILILIIIALIIVIGNLVFNNANQEEGKIQEKTASENTVKKVQTNNEDFDDDEFDSLDKDNQEDKKEVNANYEWEEYPENVNSYIEESYGNEIDDNSVSYSLMSKTLYSLNKNHSNLKLNYLSIVQDLLMLGDSTEYIDRDSNYARYCYPDSEANDLSAKITKPITYDIAVFNGLYYDGYYSLEQCVKDQYEALVINKDYKHYEDIPEEFYYQLDSILIMNGNNESEEDYKANSRAKKIKIIVNGEKEYVCELKDTNKAQIIDIGYKQNTIEKPVHIEIQVLDSYEGEKSSDIYISDVQCAISSNIPQGL